MDLAKLSEPLPIDQIDFRVQSINRGGYATILAYKDARADMQRLDDVCGPLGWKREHLNGNHNCIVSVFDPDRNHWVSKEDTGTESNAEAAKGLASDSFKRACTNWGIGRELYDYPAISVKLIGDGEKNDKGWPTSKGGEWIKDGRNNKPQATFNLKVREWTWFSQWVDGQLAYLAAKDASGMRFSYGTFQKEISA